MQNNPYKKTPVKFETEAYLCLFLSFNLGIHPLTQIFCVFQILLLFESRYAIIDVFYSTGTTFIYPIYTYKT